MYPQKLKLTGRHPDKGFTLIEMSMVILILGIAVAMFAQSYDLYRKRQNIIETGENVTTASNAVGDFRSANGRYPCPASLTAGPTDPDYGREDCSDYSAVPPGDCTAGSEICVRESIGNVSYTDPFTAALVTQKVPIYGGALPWRSLGLQEEQSYDGHGLRLVYWATLPLMYASSYSAGSGGIDIIGDVPGQSLLPQPGSAHYVVFSVGANKAGGFTRDGIRALDCPATGPESENCSLSLAQAAFRFVEKSESDDVTKRNDDVVSYFTPKDMTPWMLSGAPDHEYDIHTRPTVDKIGLNKQLTDTLVRQLEVSGTVRLRDDTGSTDNAEGKLKSEEICDAYNSSLCFPSSLIAGETNIVADTNIGGGLWCPPGEFMVGIQDSQPDCSGAIEQRCAPPSFMSGIGTDGIILCAGAPPASCESETVTICAAGWGMGGTPEEHTLDPAGHGTIAHVYGGWSIHASWKCNNGAWNYWSLTGACQCTPSALAPEEVSCQTASVCGTQFSGTKTRQWEVQCPVGGYWQGWVTLADNCVCENTRVTNTQSCPTGYNTGIITGYREHLCDQDPPQCSGFIYESDTCACQPLTEYQSLACGAYYSGGSYQQQNQFICDQPAVAPATGATGRWTGWADVPGQGFDDICACNQGQVLSPHVVNCQSVGSTPAGIPSYDPTYTVGNVSFPRTINCTPDGPETVINWGNPTDTCAVTPPVVCAWVRLNSIPIPGSPVSTLAGDPCACGTSNGVCSFSGNNYSCGCQQQ